MKIPKTNFHPQRFPVKTQKRFLKKNENPQNEFPPETISNENP